jgi:arylsulfatase
MNNIDEPVADMLKRKDEIGGPNTYPLYPFGWAHAMNTPFQWCKQVASHFGGTRDGMVVTWPGRIKDKGGLRSQFHHVIDVAPTILDAVGIPAPNIVNGVPQKPMSGVSMVYTFDDAKASSTRVTQYFELYGNRAIYHDGWIAAAGPVEMPWSVMPVKKSIDDIPWELYHISDDYSEAVNLADKEPAKLRELQDLFWIEAAKYHVLPIMLGKIPPGPPPPNLAAGRSNVVYYPGAERIPNAAAPNLVDISFHIDADATIPEKGANGILFAQGGRFNGHALYLLNGKLVYHYSFLNIAHYNVTSNDVVPAGKHRLTADFKYDGGGAGKGGLLTLLMDGKPIGSGRIERTVPLVLAPVGEGLSVGKTFGAPLNDDFKPPFAFTGTLEKVTVTRGSHAAP